MPPKKVQKAAELPVAWSEWPAPAKVALARSLVRFNRLDTVTNVSKNLANFACVCREARDICRDLWPEVLAAVEPGPEDPPTPWESGAAPSKRFEKIAFPRYYDPTAFTSEMLARRGRPAPTPAEIRAEVQHGEFEGSLVPPRVAAEIIRLSSRYLAETRACKEFGLTLKDLQPLEEFPVGEQGVPMGFMRLRRLSDVARVAQDKHKTVETLQVLLKLEEEKEWQREVRRHANKGVADAWISQHTNYEQILKQQERYANAKRRKVLRNEAVVEWIENEFDGDVAAATRSPAVKSAPEGAQRSIASTIRAAWRAGGGGGQQQQAGGGGGGGEGDWDSE